MLGDTYGSGSGNYTEYDPESPRPNGLFPPEGGQQRGFGDFGAPPPPPPPPSMNLPGSSMAFGSSRIPGPRTDAGPPPSGMAGPPAPLWPPSRIPASSKPPIGSSHPVSRTSSIQSEGWTNRDSVDQQHARGMTESVPENTLGGFGPPPTAMMPHETLAQNITAISSGERAPLESAFHLTNSAMKKPPPAIAKESPLKALYARGAENYDGSRRKINLKMTLDSVATDTPPGETNEGSMQPIPGPYPPSHVHVEHRASLDESASHAPEPAFFPFQPQGGSNHGSSQSFYADDGEKRNVFNPMNPPHQTSQPQYEEPSKATHDQAPPIADIQHRQKKKRRLFKKRFVLSQILFFITLLINPSWTITRATVAGALVQSVLAGYTMMDKREFSSMLHAQFGEGISVAQYMGVIQDSFDLVHGASESAWEISVDTLECESSTNVCYWARNVLHAWITAGMAAQKTMVATYRNIPHILHAGKALTASLVSGEFWKGRETSFQSSIFEKTSKMHTNALQLSRSTMDFTICAGRASLRGGNLIHLSESVLTCCISSYEKFLEGSPGEADVMASSVPEMMKEEEEVQQQEPVEEFEHEEDPYQVNQTQSIDSNYEPDQYKIPEAYHEEPLRQIEQEGPVAPVEPMEEDAVSPDLPMSHEENITDHGRYYEDMEPIVDEQTPPLGEFTTQEEDSVLPPPQTLDDHVPVEENSTIPEYVEESESHDDVRARLRRRLEKEKVLADRKKRREAEKSHRSIEKGDVATHIKDAATTDDVRSILSDKILDEKTEDSVPLVTERVRSKIAPVVAQTTEQLTLWLSNILAILRTNLTHILTALASALIASLLFIIQGRRTGHTGDAEMDASTPRARRTKAMLEEEPATVYKSAEPVEKKTTRRISSRKEASAAQEDRPRQRSKTPRAKRSSKSTTATIDHEKEERPSRRSSRTRSTSRKAR